MMGRNVSCHLSDLHCKYLLGTETSGLASRGCGRARVWWSFLIWLWHITLFFSWTALEWCLCRAWSMVANSVTGRTHPSAWPSFASCQPLWAQVGGRAPVGWGGSGTRNIAQAVMTESSGRYLDLQPMFYAPASLCLAVFSISNALSPLLHLVNSYASFKAHLKCPF